MLDPKVQAPSAGTLRNRLKLRHLVLLAELVSRRSLRKAALATGMSQPAATRLLHELEDLLGAPLFERSSRGMVPTPLGRLMTHHAAMVLEGLDHVSHEAAALLSGSAGDLRVGVFPGVSPALVADAVARIKQQTPRLRLRLVDGPNEVLLSSLREHGLDLVIGRAPLAEGSEDFGFELLHTEHFAVVCSSARAELPTEAVLMPCLADHPWVLPAPGAALRSNLELLFRSQCGHMPGDIVESASTQLGLALVATSARLTAVPGWVLRDAPDQARLRVLIQRLPAMQGPIGLITRHGDAPSLQAQRFAEAMRAACRAPAQRAG
jgi:DNA-binding transcriptional LysR family regulator